MLSKRIIKNLSKKINYLVDRTVQSSFCNIMEVLQQLRKVQLLKGTKYREKNINLSLSVTAISKTAYDVSLLFTEQK